MKKTIKILLLPSILFWMTTGSLGAQGTSEIFLIKMSVEGENYVFENPLKITQREGYNNQPHFHPSGGSLLFSSGEGDNTEIYRYDIGSRETVPLTATPDAEYSPTVMPGGRLFSVIQLVITEGPRLGAQPLMAFPFDGKEPRTIFESGLKVGYHAWINEQRVALFILGTPNTLQIYNRSDKKAMKIAEDIGRSLYKVPGEEAVSYSQNREGKPGMITAYDLMTGKSRTIVSMKEGNDFYAWTPSGVLVMGVDSKLFIYDPDKHSDWTEITDLSQHGIKRITRLAVDPTEEWLAVVNNR